MTGRGSLAPAIRLFHRRWSVPVVATLHARRGARFVELANRLGVSRDVLAATLRDLQESGLVTKNPGYGHPLRPEYILTPAGDILGEAAIPVTGAVTALDALDVALKKWPMLVVVAIGRGATRFGQLEVALPGITPRALTAALRDIQDASLATRTVDPGPPRTTTYALTPAAEQAHPTHDAFCRTCAEIALRA